LVRLRPGFARRSSTETFEVTRLLPADQRGELFYRIKSPTGVERAVNEHEITAQLPDA